MPRCPGPFAHRAVRVAQTAVRAEVGDDRDAASRRRGPHDTILFGKRSQRLNAGLNSYRTVPIDRDVAAPLHAMSPQRFPDLTATLRHHPREVGWPDLPTQDGEGRWRKIVELHNQSLQDNFDCLPERAAARRLPFQTSVEEQEQHCTADCNR